MLGDRLDRPERRRRAPSVLERGEHQAVDRIDRPARTLRRRGRPPDRLPPGRLSVPAVVRRPASRRSSATSRCSAASASTCSGSTRQRPRALAPGLNADGVLAATFCQRDGIADPNGVTMGFAKTAQSLGVTIERDVEVTGITVDGRSRRRGRDDARHDRDAHRRERRRAPRAADRPDGRRRRAGRSDPPPHLHRGARPGRRRCTCPRRTSWSSTSRRPSTSIAKAPACCSAWAIGRRRRPSTPRCSGTSCRR